MSQNTRVFILRMLQKENVYKMYQEGTVKLGEASNKGKKALKQVATITTYKDIPYIDV